MSGTYNYWLVALSFGIAVLTSYTAIALVERVTASMGAVRRAWLWGARWRWEAASGACITSGCWHFELPVPVRYHLPTVALSLLAGVLGVACRAVRREPAAHGRGGTCSSAARRWARALRRCTTLAWPRCGWTAMPVYHFGILAGFDPSGGGDRLCGVDAALPYAAGGSAGSGRRCWWR